MSWKISILVFCLCFVLAPATIAQERASKHKFGFLYGQGGQRVLGAPYIYEVNFFKGQYYYYLTTKKGLDIEILVQPQYNVTSYKYYNHLIERIPGIEFGVNAGLLIRKHVLKDYLSLYACLSAGPHYVTGVPSIQADGFIFSDNLFVGMNLRIYRNLYLDLRPGFRHISNANLKQPNRGINNFIFSGGIMLNLPQSN